MHPRQRTHLRPGILLDRDGTIIMDHGYVGFGELRVEFIDGAPDAIARFNRAGIPVAVVTNRPAWRGACTGSEQRFSACISTSRRT